jgi:hypothetical protein
MDFIYTFLVVFILLLALFLGQIAMQFIRLERKIENSVEILEEELIDIFGSAASKNSGSETSSKG